MSTRRTVLLVAALLTAALFALSLRARAPAGARDDLAAEAAALARTYADLRELAALRARREVVAAQKRPTQDVLAQVNETLRDAGVPADRLKGLDPEADTPAQTGGRYRVQTLRLSLDRLTLPEVGSFLARWRERQSVWTPASLELAHENAVKDRADLFSLRVVLAATYLSDASEEPRR